MKKKILIMIATTMLVGCKPFEGTLEVVKPIKFNLKKTIFGKTKKKTFKTGSFSTKISFKSKSKAVLIINADKKYKINLETKDGDTLPKFYGNISFTSDELKQPWDLKGHVDSKTSYSDDRTDWQGCSYTRNERICFRSYNSDRDHYRRGRRICDYELVTIYGERRVEYHYKYTDSTVKLKLLQPGTENLLSKFRGTRHESDKIVTHSGVCR